MVVLGEKIGGQNRTKEELGHGAAQVALTEVMAPQQDESELTLKDLGLEAPKALGYSTEDIDLLRKAGVSVALSEVSVNVWREHAMHHDPGLYLGNHNYSVMPFSEEALGDDF